MKYHSKFLKFLKSLSLWQFLLLFPIAELYVIIDDIKYSNLDGFITDWIIYLFLAAFWFFIIGGTIYIIYIIYTGQIAILIPLAVLLGIIFLLVGIPAIIYKLAIQKPRK